MLHASIAIALYHSHVATQAEASPDKPFCEDAELSRDESCFRLACFASRLACDHPSGVSSEDLEVRRSVCIEVTTSEINSCEAARSEGCEYVVRDCDTVSDWVDDAYWDHRIEEADRREAARPKIRSGSGRAYFLGTVTFGVSLLPVLARTVINDTLTGDLVSTHAAGALIGGDFDGTPFAHANVETAVLASGYVAIGIPYLHGAARVGAEVRAGHDVVKGYFRYGWHIIGGGILYQDGIRFRRRDDYARDHGVPSADVDSVQLAKGRDLYWVHRLAFGVRAANIRYDGWTCWGGALFERTSLPWSSTLEPRKTRAWAPGAEAGFLINHDRVVWGLSTEFLVPYDSMYAGDPMAAVLAPGYGATHPVSFLIKAHFGGLVPDR